MLRCDQGVRAGWKGWYQEGQRQEVWSLIQTQGGGTGRCWFLAAGGCGVQERECSQGTGRGGGMSREEGHWGLSLSVAREEDPPCPGLSFSRKETG